jgi:hypothetical protein
VPVSADYKGPLAGPVTVEYWETSDNGTTLAATTTATLR